MVSLKIKKEKQKVKGGRQRRKALCKISKEGRVPRSLKTEASQGMGSQHERCLMTQTNNKTAATKWE